MQARCRLDAGSMLCLDGGSMARCLLDASTGEDILVMGKCVQNIVQHLDTSHMMHNAFKLVRGVGEVSQSQTKKKRPPKVTVGAFCKLREPHGSKLGRSDGK